MSAILHDVAGVNLTQVFAQVNSTRDQAVAVRMPFSQHYRVDVLSLTQLRAAGMLKCSRLSGHHPIQLLTPVSRSNQPYWELHAAAAAAGGGQ